jgi:arylsulfatase A
MRWPNRIPAKTSSDHLVSLTDFFATFSEIIQETLPRDGAEDSASFLASALGNAKAPDRAPIVNHSNHGEFAYRDGPWKLVFRNREKNQNQCRGESRIVELYNFEQDIAESNNLAPSNPKIVQQLTTEFDQIVSQGASRSGIQTTNDAKVTYTTTQIKRWANPQKVGQAYPRTIPKAPQN